MPQVPYSPVPDVRPSGQPTPDVRVSAPAAAFGSTIASAVEGAGGKLDQVGNEIFSRAMALQDLQNRADADQAFQNFVEAHGKVHADFSSLEGKDRVDAFPKYISDTHELRDQQGQGLNPMAKKLYDSESRSQAARMIFNGAGTAAEAQKSYLVNNAKSQADILTKTVSDDPNNEDLYNQRITQVGGIANYISNAHGMGDNTPYEQDLSAKLKSQITLTRILSVAKTEPTKAMELYKRLEPNLYGPDKLHAEVSVWGQTRSVGAQNIASNIFNGGFDENGKQTTPLTDMLTSGQQEAEKLMPGDVVLRNAVEQGIRTLNTRKFQTDKVTDWEAGQQIRDLIQQHPEIQNEQQLRAMPEARAVLDSMNFKGRGIDAPGYIHRYIQSKFQEVNEQNYYSLRSLATSNRDEFLDTDFTKEQLNARQIDSLNQMRKSLIHKPDDDPMLRRALGWMQNSHGAELEALGVFHRTADSKDDYDKYAGTMLQAIEAWTSSNKRPPTFNEITNEIGPEVIKQRTTPGWFFNSQTPTYKTEVPQDFVDKARKDFPNRSTEQIQKDYMSFIFTNMFGPTVSPQEITKRSAGAAVNEAPQVPTSK